MARVTLLPNGVTASFPRVGPMAEPPPKRGKVKGWSVATTRRLVRWFFSVDGAQVDGRGFALSLTVRDCPPAPADWARVRRVFLKRVERLGLVRGQWLTEFQRRGVPHMHMALYFPGELAITPAVLSALWVEVAAEFGAGARSQSVQEITGLVGWLQYQAKHSVRGVKHYQRASVPAAWREGTGRLWGALGDWPVREEVIEVSTASFHRFRRLMRGWLLGGARVELAAAAGPWPSHWDVERAVKREDAALRRVRFLGGMLRCSHRELSPVRAVGEFCPEEVSRELLAAAELRSLSLAIVELATGEVLTGWAGLEAACRGEVECLGRWAASGVERRDPPLGSRSDSGQWSELSSWCSRRSV